MFGVCFGWCFVVMFVCSGSFMSIWLVWSGCRIGFLMSVFWSFILIFLFFVLFILICLIWMCQFGVVLVRSLWLCIEFCWRVVRCFGICIIGLILCLVINFRVRRQLKRRMCVCIWWMFIFIWLVMGWCSFLISYICSVWLGFLFFFWSFFLFLGCWFRLFRRLQVGRILWKIWDSF